MLTREHDGRTILHMSGPVGAGVGAGLALVMVAPIWLFLSKEAGFDSLAVQLGFVGGVYFGFSVAQGSVSELLIEFFQAGAFMFAAVLALGTDSPGVLAGGYLAHGVWDALHHPRAVTTPVRGWYPPFCAVFDVVVAAFVLVRF